MLIQQALGAFKLQKEGAREGEGRKVFSHHHTRTSRGKSAQEGKDLCVVEAWLHTSASRLQDKPVATRQYYAAETGQAAANSLH